MQSRAAAPEPKTKAKGRKRCAGGGEGGDSGGDQVSHPTSKPKAKRSKPDPRAVPVPVPMDDRAELKKFLVLCYCFLFWKCSGRTHGIPLHLVKYLRFPSTSAKADSTQQSLSAGAVLVQGYVWA